MGTTLTNGIYLPNEGEKNCYAGLKTNWEILDQKVADITALQQAVAGALHREIVESLPTTDIDPNTIYMILSGTSATENVYNEFMYVNNAWELIGTSATDLTNYYTKGDVDGLLVLKANASDLTSHTGDTTIHVTASDKTKWTNSANTVVLRLAKTALTPSSSTNAFSNLDDSTALKVGDKVMDTAGVLFEVTAIDTQNSTFTIGTALVDLAQDSDVVHKSGDETISGTKTFTDNNMIKTSSPKVLLINTSQTGNTAPSSNTASFFRFDGGTVNNFGGIQFEFLTTGENRITNYVKDITTAKINIIQQRANSTTAMTVFNADLIAPATDGITALGSSSKRWSDVYGMNYYYGSNNVEFSTKFVTTDTAQTISGNKTFSSNVNVYNSDSTANIPSLVLKNSIAERGATTSTQQTIYFTDKNDTALGYINCGVTASTISQMSLRMFDANNQSNGFSIRKSTTATTVQPITDNTVNLGTTTAKWSDVQTYKVNALEPSSLSLPSDRSARIDISSYFTNTGTGNTNDYSVPANGFIFLNLLNAFAVICYSIDGTNNVNYAQSYFRPVDGQIYILFPVRKNDTFRTLWTSNGGTITVTGAHFIPCLGNV